MTWSRRVAALTAAAGLVLLSFSPASAEDTEAFTLDDEQVADVSGMASDSNQQVYWLVNAGADDQQAFAVDPQGEVVGSLRFDARMEDPQALAYREQRLYVGDIGDESRGRSSIHVYRFQSPDPSVGTPNDVRDIELQYSDGQARDARAMLVGNSGRIFVITHESEGGIWATTLAGSSRQMNVLERIADAPGYVTDAAWLPNGNIVVRNYNSLQVIEPNGFTVVGAAQTPYQDKGEALSLGLDGTDVLLASAGTRQPVYSMTAPTKVGTIPEAAPTPLPSPTPTPTPGASPTAQPTDGGNQGMPTEDPGADAGASRQGTVTALWLAAAVAVLAGLIVYVTGRSAPATRGEGRRRTTVTEPVDETPEDETPESEDVADDGHATPGEVADDDSVLAGAGVEESEPESEEQVVDEEPQPADEDATPQADEDAVPEVGEDATDEEPVGGAAVPHVAPRRAFTIVEDGAQPKRPRRAFTIVEHEDRGTRPRRGILPNESEGALIRSDRSDQDQQDDLDWLYPPEED